MLAGVRDWPSQIPYREAAPSTIKPLRRPARSVPGILSLDGLAELETERQSIYIAGPLAEPTRSGLPQSWCATHTRAPISLSMASFI